MGDCERFTLIPAHSTGFLRRASFDGLPSTGSGRTVLGFGWRSFDGLRTNGLGAWDERVAVGWWYHGRVIRQASFDGTSFDRLRTNGFGVRVAVLRQAQDERIGGLGRTGSVGWWCHGRVIRRAPFDGLRTNGFGVRVAVLRQAQDERVGGLGRTRGPSTGFLRRAWDERILRQVQDGVRVAVLRRAQDERVGGLGRTGCSGVVVPREGHSTGFLRRASFDGLPSTGSGRTIMTIGAGLSIH